MPKTFADFQQGLADRIQDDALKLPSNARDQCIREALTGRYSRARPLHRSKDLAGNSVTFKWTLNTANFPAWMDEFSVILDLEYPADERIPVTLAKDEWTQYQLDNNVRELRLFRITPATGKNLRVFYTALHAEDGTDVPDGDFEGACNLAAALACQRLAAQFSQLGDSSIGADAVDYRSKASGYGDLARNYEERFKEIFGLDKEEEQPAASKSAEWPVRLEEGTTRLIH